MRRRPVLGTTSIALLVAFCLILTNSTLWAYSGGTGEPNDPYQIATAADLIELGNDPNNYDKHFILTADIDLSGYVFDKAVIAPVDKGDGPDNEEIAFSGVFDGKGYVIRYLKIQGESCLGLFGLVNKEATISSLGVEDLDVNGTSSIIGGLVGYNKGVITSSYSTGSVKGTTITVSGGEGADVNDTSDGIGGLVGENDGGVITSCYSAGLVNGNDYLGGLVGLNSGGIISRCYSTGTVNGVDDIGGLVGRNHHGIVTMSFSTKTVNGSDYIGGLVAVNVYHSVVTSSYFAGTINGDDYVGGLVGWNLFYSSITDSCSHGPVNGNCFVGGLVGEDSDGSITSSYSIGSVNGDYNVGGLLGSHDNSSVISSFWNVDTSGVSESQGGVGLSAAEMQKVDTYLDAGWDLVGEKDYGTGDVWMTQDGNYPNLVVFSGYIPPEPNGAGIAGDPYVLADINDIGTIWYRPTAYYRMEEDIDLAGVVWNSAVVPGFGGYFDGNGYVVRNLHIQGGGHLGLFGYCSSKGTISNLGLDDVNVNGTGDYIGGLLGENEGQVISCHSSGIVCGRDSVGNLQGMNRGLIASSHGNGDVCGENGVGGLVGRNYGNVISSCSTATVSGARYVGGLAGLNGEIIKSSYSTGAVSGVSCVGGLVGENFYASVISCYSNGLINGNFKVGGLVGWDYQESTRRSLTTTSSIATSSFWDIETSGQSQSDGGTGLTSAESQDINTYLNAGWDFVDEADNGTDDIWWMPASDYPRLWWEE